MNCIYIFKGQEYDTIEALQDAMAEAYKNEGGYLGTLSQYHIKNKRIQELRAKGIKPSSPVYENTKKYSASTKQAQEADIERRRQEASTNQLKEIGSNRLLKLNKKGENTELSTVELKLVNALIDKMIGQGKTAKEINAELILRGFIQSQATTAAQIETYLQSRIDGKINAKVGESISNEINAKYDAELAALQSSNSQQSSTTDTAKQAVEEKEQNKKISNLVNKIYTSAYPGKQLSDINKAERTIAEYVYRHYVSTSENNSNKVNVDKFGTYFSSLSKSDIKSIITDQMSLKLKDNSVSFESFSDIAKSVLKNRGDVSMSLSTEESSLYEELIDVLDALEYLNEDVNSSILLIQESAYSLDVKGEPSSGEIDNESSPKDVEPSTVDRAIETLVSDQELQELAKEAKVETKEEAKEKIKEELRKDIEERGLETNSNPKSLLEKIVAKIKKALIAFLITTSIGTAMSSFNIQRTEGPLISVLNIKNNVSLVATSAANLLPSVYQQYAYRGLHKMGIAEIKEQKIEISTIKPSIRKPEQAIIDKAISFLGERESGDTTKANYGSQNLGFANPEFEKLMVENGFKKGYAWCAIFLKTIVNQVANSQTRAEVNQLFTPSVNITYNNILKSNSKNFTVIKPSEIKPGSIVFYTDKDYKAGHIVLVTKVNEDGTFETIEGNTNDSGEREGYEVARRIRTIDNEKLMFRGAVNPNYDQITNQNLNFYNEYQAVKDNTNRDTGESDSLIVFERQVTNEDGFSYIPGPSKANMNKDEHFTGVTGVAHFMLSGRTDLTNATSNDELDLAKKRILKQYLEQNKNGWVPTFRKQDNGVTLKFKKLEQIDSSDIVIARLYQRKFGHLDFNSFKRSKSFVGGKKAIMDTVRNQGVDQLQFTTLDSYGRISGGSAFFIFEYKGQTIVREAAGSVKFLQSVGNTIVSEYKVDPNNLTIGFFDAGSYAAKPKAKDGVVETRQYRAYNHSQNSGASLLIPEQNPESPTPVQKGGAASLALFMLLKLRRRGDNVEEGSTLKNASASVESLSLGSPSTESQELAQLEKELKELEDAIRAEADDEAAKEASKYVTEDGEKFYELAPNTIEESEVSIDTLEFLSTEVLDPDTFDRSDAVNEFADEYLEDLDSSTRMEAESLLSQILSLNSRGADSSQALKELENLLNVKPKSKTVESETGRETKELQTRLRHRVWDPEKGYFYSEAIGTKSQVLSGRDHFGVRIPTQDKHSMAVIRFVDYLSDYNKNTLILPYELVLLTGMDFDIDSFYVHSPKGTAGDYLSETRENLDEAIDKELLSYAKKEAKKKYDKSEIDSLYDAIEVNTSEDNAETVRNYISKVLANLSFLEDEDLAIKFIEKSAPQVILDEYEDELDTLIEQAIDYKSSLDEIKEERKEQLQELLESDEYIRKRNQMKRNWEIFQDLDNQNLEEYEPQSMDEANNMLLELQKRLVNSSREVMGSPATMDDPNKLTDEVTEGFVDDPNLSQDPITPLVDNMSDRLTGVKKAPSENTEKFIKLFNENNILTIEDLKAIYAEDSLQSSLLSLLPSDYKIVIQDVIVSTSPEGKKVTAAAKHEIAPDGTKRVVLSRSYINNRKIDYDKFLEFTTLLTHEIVHEHTLDEINSNTEYKESMQQLAYDVLQDIINKGELDSLGTVSNNVPYLAYIFMGRRALDVKDGDYSKIPKEEYDVGEIVTHLLSDSKFSAFAEGRRPVESSAMSKLIKKFLDILKSIFGKMSNKQDGDSVMFRNLYDQLKVATVVSFRNPENLEEALFKTQYDIYTGPKSSASILNKNTTYLNEADRRAQAKRKGKWLAGQGGLGETRAGNTNNAFDMSSKSRAQESIDIGGKNIGLPARANIMQQRFATSNMKVKKSFGIFGKTQFTFKDEKSERVVDKISQALSMMVDNAKEQLAKQLNLSLTTLAPALSMIGVGVPSTTVYHITRSSIVEDLGEMATETLVKKAASIKELNYHVESKEKEILDSNFLSSSTDHIKQIINQFGYEALNDLLLAAKAYNNDAYNKNYVYKADALLTKYFGAPTLFTESDALFVEVYVAKEFMSAYRIADMTRNMNKVLDLFKQLKPEVDQLKQLPSILEKLGITYELTSTPGQKPLPRDIRLTTLKENTENVTIKDLPIDPDEILKMLEDHPDIKLFIQNAISASYIYGNFFMAHTDVANGLVNEASESFKSKSYRHMSRARRHFLNYISSSIYTKIYAEERDLTREEVQEKMTDVMFQRDLTDRVNQAASGKLLRGVSSDYVRRLKANEFIKYLGTDKIAYTSDGPMKDMTLSTLFVNTWTQKNFDLLESFINSWEDLAMLGEELRETEGDTTISDLVDDLLLYLVAKDSLGFTSGSFIRSISPKAFLPIADGMKRVHEIFKNLEYKDLDSVDEDTNEEFIDITGISLNRSQDHPWIKEYITLFLAQERNSDVLKIGSMNKLSKFASDKGDTKSTLSGGPIRTFKSRELNILLNKVAHIDSKAQTIRLNFNAGIPEKGADYKEVAELRDRAKKELVASGMFSFDIFKNKFPEVISGIQNRADGAGVKELYIKNELEYSIPLSLDPNNKYPKDIKIQFQAENGTNQQGMLTHKYKYNRSLNKGYVQLAISNGKYNDYVWVDIDTVTNKDRLSPFAKNTTDLSNTKLDPSAVTYALASPFGSSNILTYAYGLDGSIALFSSNYTTEKSRQYNEYMKSRGKTVKKKKPKFSELNIAEGTRKERDPEINIDKNSTSASTVNEEPTVATVGDKIFEVDKSLDTSTKKIIKGLFNSIENPTLTQIKPPTKLTDLKVNGHSVKDYLTKTVKPDADVDVFFIYRGEDYNAVHKLSLNKNGRFTFDLKLYPDNSTSTDHHFLLTSDATADQVDQILQIESATYSSPSKVQAVVSGKDAAKTINYLKQPEITC